MKISTLQDNLKQGLMAVGHIAGKNVNLPILNHVLIECKEGNISLITTDLEMGVVSKIRGKVVEDGSIAVEAKIMSEYVAVLPNDKVDIQIDGNTLQIEAGKYKTKINCQPADEFPLIPTIEKNNHYQIAIEEFKRSLSQVIFAVSNSDTRLELSGVQFCFEDSKLTMAATDSFRLSEKTVDLKKSSDAVKKIIVPSKTIQELIRIISNSKESVSLDGGVSVVDFYVSDNQVLFIVGNTELISRLIEGQFPDYKQIIPTNHKTKALTSRTELIRAVKASSLFSKTGVNDISLDMPEGGNKILLSSASGITGESVTETDSKVEGQDNGVVLNYKYLLDGLNSMDTDNVIIEMIDGNTPCVFRPENNQRQIYIIMPIKQ